MLKDEQGRATGARVRAASTNGETPTEFDVRADAVVNAGGVWADEVRALDEAHHPHAIRPAKGIHITVPWSKVQNDIAAVVPVPKDRRSVFVVPWGEHTYIGTTDTDYDGPIDDPQCTREDVEYLLGAQAQAYFANETFEYPLVAGVTTNVGLPELETLEAPDIDLNDLDTLQATVQMIKEVGLA